MRASRWQAGAVALATTASAALCVVPVVATSSSSAVPGEPVVTTTGSSTLLAEQGPGFLLVLAVPVLLTALPLLLGRWAGLACTGLLGVLVVLSGFSIGFWYLPALVVAVLVVAAKDAERPSAALPVEGRWPGY